MPRIDYRDEVIRWLPSYPVAERIRPVLGRCPHDCAHRRTAVTGWGPDPAHYQLIRCTDTGCQGECRGWLPAPGDPAQIRVVAWHLLGPGDLAGR